MKIITKITGSILPLAIILTIYSCKEAKPTQNDKDSSPQSSMSEESEDNLVNVLEFKNNNMHDSFQHYKHIKTALVNGDKEEVTLGATMLLNYTEGEAVQTSVRALIDATDISAQRTAFAEVNAQMETLFKQNLSSGTLYKQFCPMALNNEGAYWFSEVKEIRNPYFGDKMLKCGSVVETIN